MRASEARKLTEEAKAKRTVERLFPAIKAIAEREQSELFLELHEATTEELELLSKLFGYKVDKVYQETYSERPDKHVGYTVKW